MPPRPPNWVIGAAAGAALTPVLAPAALGIVGFSAAGPVAGTLAAAIQSSIGNVAAGSAFAVAQSIAMGGAIPTGVYAASGVAAGVAGWAASWFGSDEPDPTLIRKQLDSNSDREKLDAMKRIIALMDKGRNVSEYFAQVVMNVASRNLEIRKLVYIYLLKYAKQEPDLTLLFIDTIRKDRTHSDPLIRAIALRVASWFGGEFDEPQIALALSDFFLGDEPDPSTLIRKQLDSGSDREKLDAMKRIIALMDKGHNVSKYFPQVAKNVDSQNLEIRKLVYIYLLKYVEDLSDGSSQEGSTGGASSKEEDVDKPSRSSVV
ncbi:adaptin N terminal region-domain-containing protein [Armillaria borealis]|uniref:Adaptin N terminal region-domain-containing protein n=1 Tax=Armillaria borealis TaxID=47425 RepID=A0AA39MDY0_9AGAR|nr:adaptin N terminal region-domain-containing protein [Armillaria borealis]